MTKQYKGFTIRCERQQSYDRRMNGNFLTVQNNLDKKYIYNSWYLEPVKEGIEFGKDRVERYLKAEAAKKAKLDNK